MSYSQVGIDTNNPAATLDVTGKATSATTIDGVIPPRLTGNQLKAKDAVYTAAQTGAIVYISAAASPTTTKTANVTSAGYYYFDGTIWKGMGGASPSAAYKIAGTIPTTGTTGITSYTDEAGVSTTTLPSNDCFF
ncbi:MAG: hypothetical protein C4K58_05725 [Flavobacteriaceae bacterium]|nr:MAG: hypothetical protein C4K58_05725 [Flavobacteriaceae bacterium]